MRNLLFFISIIVLFSSCQQQEIKILVFSKTTEFRHESIETGAETIKSWGQKKGYNVFHTEDADIFDYNNLKAFHTVVFLNTSGNMLDVAQQYQFEQYIKNGGGFTGVHGAAASEYGWPWYSKLVGGIFVNHPHIQEAEVVRTDKKHPSTSHISDRWTHTDEWYNYKEMQENLDILLWVDESSYEGGTQGSKHHPIAWHQNYEGGKSFYTGLGHTEESYQNEVFLNHLFAGIESTFSDGMLPAIAEPEAMPNEGRFTRTILTQNLDEPMEMDIFPNGNILVVERKGGIKLYDQSLEMLIPITKFPVHTKYEDGLLGLAIDPDFTENHFIYLCYSPVGSVPVQHVSRFVFKENKLDLSSEKVIIEIPVQRDECCHSGGGLEFGPDGLLFIGIGDNTNPFASDGYAPIDERAERSPWDAQRSSGNTNDLRGKILRIQVNDDGSYSIPPGNLFPEGTAGTRPEIYTMGLRNPFRFHIDSKNSWLFWGDVGPDAGKDGENRGPKGFDGINLAMAPGNWGWPYIRGNHRAYYDYDFTSKESGAIFAPDSLINDSPNNTGLKNIPDANPYWIYYSYDKSLDFPWVDIGGKNPMAGPVFYKSDFLSTSNTFPGYFEGKVLVYEWMRDWIYLVTFDTLGNYVKSDRFLPNSDFHNPIDMLFGSDGALYILEYGEKWFAQNVEARINKIEYRADNQAPIARITSDASTGACPATINFSGNQSEDYDHDKLSFAWSFDSDEVQSQMSNPSYTFKIPGTYQVGLTVTDPAGNQSSTSYPVAIGNEAPNVQVNVGNNPYFWYGKDISYNVEVTDYEDGNVSKSNPEKVKTSIQYFAEGQDMTLMAQGHLAQMEASLIANGKVLMDGSDCKSCHHPMEQINGPSYFEISRKYTSSDKNYLVEKVLKGGNGVWGETVMSAHPQLSEEDAAQMIDWILNLDNISVSEQKSIPLKGEYTFNAHDPEKTSGTYLIMATYIDEGGMGQQPLTGRKEIFLSYPQFEMENYLDANPEASVTYKSKEACIRLNQELNLFKIPNLFLDEVESVRINIYVDKIIEENNSTLNVIGQNQDILGSFELSTIEGQHQLSIPITKSSGYQDINIQLNDPSGEMKIHLDKITFEYKKAGAT